MKVMLDTNVLISAVLFPNGRTAEAFKKALLPPCEPMVCDYIVDELHRKFREKFPDRLMELEAFLYNLLFYVLLVQTPEERMEKEAEIRDPKDRPILRAALCAHADALLTGDKDFLEAAITEPRIMSVHAFLNME